MNSLAKTVATFAMATLPALTGCDKKTAIEPKPTISTVHTIPSEQKDIHQITINGTVESADEGTLTIKEKEYEENMASMIGHIQYLMIEQITSMFGRSCGGTTGKFIIQSDIGSNKGKTRFVMRGMIELSSEPPKEILACMKNVHALFYRESKKRSIGMNCIMTQEDVKRSTPENKNLDPGRFYKPVGFDCEMD